MRIRTAISGTLEIVLDLRSQKALLKYLQCSFESSSVRHGWGAMLYLLSCALKTKAEVAAHRHVLSFKSICFLLWIHELLHLCLVFGDACITIVECRQFIQKTFIVQTKLKMIWGIKPCPSSGFQCLGKHCSAKSTHVYLLV